MTNQQASKIIMAMVYVTVVFIVGFLLITKVGLVPTLAGALVFGAGVLTVEY